MIRAKAKRLRTPRLHDPRGSMTQTVGRSIKEDWSFRSSSYKTAAKAKGVYLIHATRTDFYKIGVAVNADARRQELQCGIPFVLQLIYFFRPVAGNACKIEIAAHAKAREQRRMSPADNEYFRFSGNDEAIVFIKQWDADNSGCTYI